jgi:hypothetical protein
MSLQLISTFNRCIKFQCTGHGTQILWWSQSSDKPHVHLAPVVRPEDNCGPTAAVLWPYGAGGTQQNHSAMQYMYQHNRSLFEYPVQLHVLYIFTHHNNDIIQLNHKDHTELPQYQQYKINTLWKNLRLLSLTHNHSYQTAVELWPI